MQIPGDNSRLQPQEYFPKRTVEDGGAPEAMADMFQGGDQGDIAGFDLRNLDKSVSPGKDFYHYANGGWLKTHPIPDNKTSMGSFDILAEHNLEQVRDILQNAADDKTTEPGSARRLIGDFYASGMDTKTIEEAGIKPLAGEFDRINSVSNLRQLQGEVAHLQGLGMTPFFSFGPTQDALDSTKTIGQADQNGLGLPDRDYYLKDDERSVTIRTAYVDHVAKTFELLGDEPAKARKEAEAVMAVETRLAQNSLDNVEARDPKSTYNIMDREQLSKLTPNLDWSAYFADRGRSDIKTINVGAPKFFKALDEQLTTTSMDDLKSYMKWNLIAGTAPYLSQKFVDESFNFNGKVLSGVTEASPRWKKVARTTDNALGDALGQEYVKTNFSPEAKEQANEILKNIKSALRDDLKTLPWMSEATRKEATAKLDTITDKIGYPSKWEDYKGLNIERGVYVDNVLKTNSFATSHAIDSIDKPNNPDAWGMTPPTVNAYYNPSNNEIVFPAGILQAPFFDPKADPAVNYGGIGVVIGHEISHGFDDQGAQYDGKGNLRDWWTSVDKENFHKRTEGIIKQADNYVVSGDLHLKGGLVVGEATADLGGVELAYQAYEKSLEGKERKDIDGFSPEQRFFLGFAQVWASNDRPEAQALQVTTDPHPIAEYRINGTLANVPEFAEAFHVKTGEPLALPADQRTELWVSENHSGHIAG